MLFALALAGAAVSCRTTPEHRPPAVAARPRPIEAADGSAVPWSAESPLQWTDYRARPPAGRDEAAATVTSLIWGFRCEGGEFTVQVVAAFFPDRSWVNPMIFAQPDSARRTLAHEQTHFDLTELYARRARRSFRALTRPCERPEEDLTALGERFVREELDAQRRYDQETANGRDGPAQSRWAREIREQLDTLTAFTAG